MDKWIKESLLILVSALSGGGIFLFMFLLAGWKDIDKGSFPDWIVAFISLLTLIITLFTVYFAHKSLSSWKEERKPEVSVELRHLMKKRLV